MSHHVLEYDVVEMKYNHCCVNNIPRGFEHASQTAVAVNENGIFVNLYLPLVCKAGKDEIRISDGYTNACKVEVTLSLECAKTVSFRIPGWSKKTVVCYNGMTATPDCGGYFAIQASQGESVVSISFDQTPRLLRANYIRDVFPLTPYLTMRYNMHEPAETLDDNKATLCIGPMLMALSTELGTDWETITKRPTVNATALSCTAEEMDREDMLCKYQVTFHTKDAKETIPMCDYASASNRFKEKDFSIFV